MSAGGSMERPFPIAAGGILAAGEGSRLRRDGWTMSKPLVRVAGVPLVERAIEGFLSAGVAPIGILFNETEQDCVRFVEERFAGAPVAVHVRTTASSFESLQVLSSRLPSGRALFSTVDAWCPAAEFVRFTSISASFPQDTSVLAVTSFVDDERPLWVRRDDTGAVREIGAVGGDAVTAGFYLFSERAREIAARGSFARLRVYLAALVEQGLPVASVEIPHVIDVDRGRDVRLAEAISGAPAAPASASRKVAR